MQLSNATDVRKNWGEFIDSVIRDKPKIIKRSRDRIIAMNFEMMQELLGNLKLTVTLLEEDDGSISGVIEELNLMANAGNEETLLDVLALDALLYADDYYREFSYWHSAPNRIAHLPLIMAIISKEDTDGVKELFRCQVGKN